MALCCVRVASNKQIYIKTFLGQYLLKKLFKMVWNIQQDRKMQRSCSPQQKWVNSGANKECRVSLSQTRDFQSGAWPSLESWESWIRRKNAIAFYSHFTSSYLSLICFLICSFVFDVQRCDCTAGKTWGKKLANERSWLCPNFVESLEYGCVSGTMGVFTQAERCLKRLHGVCSTPWWKQTSNRSRVFLVNCPV